jgi:hypothetical protein
MRCSLSSKLITAAGPGFNVLAGIALALLLLTCTRLTLLSYLLWLCCAFNVLVACGYLMVGGATVFGDWAVLFASVTPAWTWRACAMGAGLAAYLACQWALSHLYGRLVAPDAYAKAVLSRRLLVPGFAAAAVACLAELAAGQRQAAGFVLPLACTILPLSTLFFSMAPEQHGRAPVGEPIVLPYSSPLLGVALVLGALFVGLIGRRAGLLS